MRRKINNLHFVGIGGAGMCGLAEVMMSLGYLVSGSDLYEHPSLQRLRNIGATIYLGHDVAHVADADCVVYSSAIQAENPERTAAVVRGIPTVPRAQMLGELLRYRPGIAVSGTHGKTTVTSMIAAVLTASGHDPTCVIGGRLLETDGNARLGEGEFIVVEADESDSSFLHLLPVIAVVTNIDNDHMEMFEHDSNCLIDTFAKFLSNLPFYGLAVVCADDAKASKMAATLPSVRTLLYGFDKNAEVRAENARAEGLNMVFEMTTQIGSIDIKLPTAGLHNVQNALAAAAVALELGIDLVDIKKGLAAYVGVGRRLEAYGKTIIADKHVDLIDDYAHHPSEINAAISALRAAYPERRLVLIFQPHRYSRTRDLLAELANAVAQADVVMLMEVYAAGESPISGAGGKDLLQAIKQSGLSSVFYVKTEAAVLEKITDSVEEGDLLVTMGAGDIGVLPEKILQSNTKILTREYEEARA